MIEQKYFRSIRELVLHVLSMASINGMQFESFRKIHQDVYKIVFKISFLQHSRWGEWGLGYSKQEETSFILASDLKLSEKIY